MPDFPTLLAPIQLAPPASAPPRDEATAAFHAWIRSSGSQELADWNDALSHIPVKGGYRNALFAARVTTLGEALVGDSDAARAARIRSIFCGVSPILEDREELWFATWGATEEGTSVVFASHQDERDIWAAAPSLVDFLLQQYRDDSYFQRDLVLPEAIAKLPIRDGGAPLPPELDPVEITERVHWIVALLFPEGDWYGLGNGLVAAPPFAAFEAEWPLLPRAPHLVAYWLFHHLVFGNREAYARVAELGRASPYPPARELASFGNGSRPSFLDASAVARLVAEALRDGVPVFEPAALAATKSTQEERTRLRAAIRKKLAALPRSAGGQLTRAVLEGAKLDDIDEEIIRDLRPDPPEPDTADRELDTLLLAKRGDAPGLGVIFQQIAEDMNEDFAAVGEDVADLCATGEASADLAAIAVLLGRQSPKSLAVAKDDRLGRLAAVAVALTKSDDENLAFVRREAARFFGQLHGRVTDTAALAAVALLRRHDPPTIEALTEAVTAREPNLRAGRALVAMLGDDAAFVPVLAALVARDFGASLDGEPMSYATTLARIAPERARAIFAPRLDADPPAILEKRAVIVGALLTTSPDDTGLRDRALALLAQLDPLKERQAAAGIALLRAVHEAGITGFAAEAARWKATKRSKHVGAPLARWFDAAADEVR